MPHCLKFIETAARRLPWASRTPWVLRERVRSEQGVETIDFHHLSCSLVEDALDALLKHRRGRRLRLVHGRGTHSRGPARLRDLVRDRVQGWLMVGYARWVEKAEGHIDIELV